MSIFQDSNEGYSSGCLACSRGVLSSALVTYLQVRWVELAYSPIPSFYRRLRKKQNFKSFCRYVADSSAFPENSPHLISVFATGAVCSKMCLTSSIANSVVNAFVASVIPFIYHKGGDEQDRYYFGESQHLCNFFLC